MDHKGKHLTNLLIIVGLLFAVSISPASGHAIHATSTGLASFAGNSPQDDLYPPTYGENAELVEHQGGTSPALAVSGHYAYLGMGPRLGIVDVSNPANPMLLGESDMTIGFVKNIAAQPPFVYVHSYVPFSPYGDQLTIFNTSDPHHPLLVSQMWLDKEIYDFEQKGNYLFFAENYGIRAMDVSDPATPQWLDSVGAMNYPIAMAIDGNYAYLVGGEGPSDYRLDIIDIHVPTNMEKLGSFLLSNRPNAVTATGHYAYLTTYNDFQVINVSNPDNPVLAGILDSPPLGNTDDLSVWGSTVYALSSSLYQVDVSDPAHPSLSNNVYTFATGSNHFQLLPGSPPSQLLGYFADYAAGMYILDLTNPASMSQLSVFANPPGQVDGIKVVGDYAYLSGSGFSTWSLSDPAHPSKIAQAGIPGVITDLASHYAYMVDRSYVINPIKIVDISEPANPQQVGAYSNPGTNFAWAVDVEEYQGDQLFAFSSADHNLFVSDVTDPSAVTAAGVYTSTGYINSFAISGPDNLGKFYAYVPDGDNYEVHIVDITDPYHPQEAGQIDHNLVGYFYSFDVLTTRIIGNTTLLYLVGGPGGSTNLYIVDVSDPAHPSLVGSLLYMLSGWPPKSITLAGDYAYLSTYSGNLQIVDIHEPANPTQAGYFREPTFTYDVAVKGDFVYLADWEGGLYVSWFGPGLQQEIPTGGGTITSPFDTTSYVFASGTFTDTVTITHTPRYAPNLPSTGRLTATGHSFALRNFAPCCEGALQPTQPFTLTIQYSPDQIISAFESTLALYSWDGTQWVKEPTSSLDIPSHTVTAHPDHFSYFALLQSQRGVFLPLLLH